MSSELQTDVADSLRALQEVVFEKRLFTIDQVVRAMDADFEGEESQRIREALIAVRKFGDDEALDAHVWVNRVLEVYVKVLAAAVHATRNGKYVAGYYGLNVNRIYGMKTPSLPSGRLRGTPLAAVRRAKSDLVWRAVMGLEMGGPSPSETTVRDAHEACVGKRRGGKVLKLHPYEQEVRRARQQWDNPDTREIYRVRRSTRGE